jgi:hypothetical protein
MAHAGAHLNARASALRRPLLLRPSGLIPNLCLCCNNTPPQLKHCTAVTLRPRTMEELSKLSALLLVHSAQMLPSLSALQLQLLVRVGLPGGGEGGGQRAPPPACRH